MNQQDMIKFIEKAHEEATQIWIEAKAAQNWELMTQAYVAATDYAEVLKGAYKDQVA